TTVGYVNNDATPTALPADGKSTSTVRFGVADQSNNNVVGDHTHFKVGVESGTGQCGTLNSSDATTDNNGFATVTSSASTDNASCWVLGDEALGGQSAEAVIYQGTAQKAAPTFHASFPTTLQAGGATTTFTIKATDPSSKSMPNIRPHFVIFPGSAK